MALLLRLLLASLQVEMSGQSRSRGAFSWWLTQEDLADRLSTDVAAAAAQIPHSTAVLTVGVSSGCV